MVLYEDDFEDEVFFIEIFVYFKMMSSVYFEFDDDISDLLVNNEL